VKPIKLGMAGLGIGGGMILAGAEKMPEVEVFAAADTRKSALDAFQTRYEGRVYDSVKALCEDPDVEVVWVATPNNMHSEHVVMAAEHGKHVVSEKPMALNVEQCERMVEAAEKNGVKLSCGHTFSLSPGIQAMRKEIKSGELGKLCALNVWMFSDWMLKPRMPEEVDVSLGGGVVYRHGPHLLDSVRLLGGGMVRSVRAMTGSWMKERPNAPGNYCAYIEFEDGTPATVAYSGYGYFNSSELTWGIGDRLYSAEEAVKVRKQLSSGEFDVEAEKEAMRFLGGAGRPTATRGTDGAGQGGGGGIGGNIHFGVYIASCERGDIRQSPTGLLVYDDNGKREVELSTERESGNGELMEMYRALREGGTIKHDGRWGMATLELIYSVMQSGRERREIMLTHQCPVKD
ncbi:MAG TPA: Gfo/Idh/MocA family oxidoreductase, partial [Chloroflexota bacterium]